MYKLLFIIAFGISSFLIVPPTYSQTNLSAKIDQGLHNADSLRRRDKYPAALKQLAMISGSVDKMSNEQLAEYFKLRGDAQLEFGKYEDALLYFSKSKEELEKLNTSKSKIDYSNIYTLNGIVYKQMGEYEKAKDILLEGIAVAQKLPTKDRNRAIKYMYNNLGESYELLGRFDEAVKTNFLALALIHELGQDVSRGAGVAHNNLGISYKQLGRYRLAKKHFEKAAEIYSEARGPNSRYTQLALRNAALAIDEYGDAEKAIPILTKRLEFYQKDPGADLSSIAGTYSTLGYVYKRLGDYENSITSYNKALSTLRSMLDYKKDLEGRILRKLAYVEIQTEAFQSARIHLDEAFEIQEATNSLAPADLVRLYNIDATYYMSTEQPEKYFSAIKKADEISLKDSKNQLNNILITRPRYIDALIDKNETTLAQLAIDSTVRFIASNERKIPEADLVLLKANLDGLRAKLACATRTVDKALAQGLDKKLEAHTKKLVAATASTPGKRNQRYSCSTCFNVGDLLNALANLHLQAYQEGIDVEVDHLGKALIALDIKQSYLTNIWQNEHFSGLPMKEKNLAKEIRQRISAYDLLIFENDGGTAAALKQNALYLDSILTLRPQLEKYISKLNSKPLDFDRTFDYTDLSKDQGMLLFHPEGDLLHVLLVRHTGITHHTIQTSSTLIEQIKTYSLFCESENKGFGESLKTLNLSARLYNQFIGWLPADLLNSESRLAIIESNPIENLPFAALLMKPVPSGALGFRDLLFAAEKHAFSYHQSPSAFFEAQQQNHTRGGIKLTALAPSQISSESMAATGDERLPTIGLEYANQEVENLVKKFKGTIYKGKQADFNGLLDAFQNSNVIHIASHAASNFIDGEYSYIVITDTTMLSGERLYARTLSNLELPADLVVLGACESGSGNLKGGEGTMSLSNVFMNAGAQSVLHTSWRVEDKRSQEVLLGFYDELAKQQPLDEALVMAQRTYLQSAGGQYLHPFYWSSFAVSGNMNAIESGWNTWLYLGIPLVLFAFFIMYWKR